MDITALRYELPSWLINTVLVLFAGSLVYGIVVRGSLIEPLLWWVGILQIVVGLFVVYLFYRFVVAVERIAEKL
ncbi:MAG: hypothetical protein U9O06_04150 [Euryarchaeota archaeon]|nr:hypothetical protein [Euryarchaeota archaeon]